MLAKIYNDLEDNNAKIYIMPFAAAATTFKEKKYDNYAIFLDVTKVETIRDLKNILMHEAGHCATGALHNLSSPYELVEKNEEKAKRWSYEQYLPFDTLKNAILNGYTEIWELAEFLDMDECFVKNALHYYISACGYII